MKRIVECPSCKTKLQIFDMGKALKQKCPRCKEDFDIEPEKSESDQEATPEPAVEKKESVEEKPEQKPVEETKETQKAVSEEKAPEKDKPEVKAGEKAPEKEKPEADKPAADEKKAGTDKKESPAPQSKPSGLVKKPLSAASKPAPAPAPAAPSHEPPLAGLSGIQFWVIVALIVCMIIIQVVFAKKQMAQLSVVNDNLITIHGKLK